MSTHFITPLSLLINTPAELLVNSTRQGSYARSLDMYKIIVLSTGNLSVPDFQQPVWNCTGKDQHELLINRGQKRTPRVCLMEKRRAKNKYGKEQLSVVWYACIPLTTRMRNSSAKILWGLTHKIEQLQGQVTRHEEIGVSIYVLEDKTLRQDEWLLFMSYWWIGTVIRGTDCRRMDSENETHRYPSENLLIFLKAAD